jgi:hypothetical protein
MARPALYRRQGVGSARGRRVDLNGWDTAGEDHRLYCTTIGPRLKKIVTSALMTNRSQWRATRFDTEVLRREMPTAGTTSRRWFGCKSMAVDWV